MGRLLARAIRSRHWVKNLLLFVPIVAGHRVTELRLVALAAIGFVSFSLAASGAYLINDLADLDSDRKHPSKRERPLPSGELSIGLAHALAPSLMVAAVAMAWWTLPSLFTASLAVYLGISLAYSAYLKRIVLLDVLVLTALYCVRIVAGGLATATFVSPWLLAFSMFLFLSLALVKRYTELRRLRATPGSNLVMGRGYQPEDVDLLRTVGPVSGYLAALVLALYINSEAASRLYRSPIVLWLIVPILIYWITRIWLLANRGSVHDDPVVFATEDRVTYFVGILIAAILIVGTVGRARA